MYNRHTVKNSNKAMTGLYIGIVKSVVDIKLSGRIKVWIPEMNSSPDDPNGWILCNYCTPFGGATNWQDISQNEYNSFEKTQTSYGFWAVPPDINNEVLVVFPGGDPSRAVWIGSLYKEFMNSMVPEPMMSPNKNKDDQDLPTAEYNKFDSVSGDASNPLKPIRPWHKHKSIGIGRQGLIKDKVRGLSGSSSMRETPSKVFGISTPGPLNESKRGRKGGHSFIMDDHEENEHISLSTRSGSKIRIDETNGMIYLINRDGTSWIQMDEDGNVDVFSAGSISGRSLLDFNIRADRDINIESGRNINIKASGDMNGDEYVGSGGGSGGDINLDSYGNMNTIVANNHTTTVENGNMSSNVNDGSLFINVSNDTNLLTDNYYLTSQSSINNLSNGSINEQSGGDHNISSGGSFIVSSSDLDMSSGAITISGSTISISSSAFNVSPTGNISANAIGAASLAASGAVTSGSASLDDLADHTHDYIDSVGSGATPTTRTTLPLSSSGGSMPSVEPSDARSASDAASASSGDGTSHLNMLLKVDVLRSFGDTTINDGDSNIEIDDWWNRDTREVETIVQRLMTFEPCPEHKKGG